MIKKAIATAVVMMAAAPAAFAQAGTGADATETVEYSSDKYKVETNRFWSNWFVGVGGGANIFFGDHDRQADFGDRLGGALDVSLGKWFTPGIGMRLMYSGLKAKGATQNGAHSTGKDVPGKGGTGYWLDQQEFNLPLWRLQGTCVQLQPLRGTWRNQGDGRTEADRDSRPLRHPEHLPPL